MVGNDTVVLEVDDWKGMIGRDMVRWDGNGMVGRHTIAWEGKGWLVGIWPDGKGIVGMVQSDGNETGW